MQNHPSILRASQGPAKRLVSSPAHPFKLGLHTLLLCFMQACASGDMDGTILGAKERSNAPPPSTSIIKEIALNESEEKQPERMQGQLLGGMQSPQGTTQSMGSSADNTTPKQVRWVEGPTVNIKSNQQHFVKIFHIPQRTRFVDYKVEQKKIKGKARYTIRFVTGQSMAAIESLKKANTSTAFEAALKDKALGAIEIGSSRKEVLDHKLRQSSAHNESHTHEAIVVSGEVKKSIWKTGRLNMAIKLCLSKKTPLATPVVSPVAVSSPRKMPSPTADKKPHRKNIPTTARDTHSQDEGTENKAGLQEDHQKHEYKRDDTSVGDTEENTGRKSSFDPSIPIEKACTQLKKKLKDPNFRLSEKESIDLLTTCIDYGAHNAQ
mgnify:CR=1 FL=1